MKPAGRGAIVVCALLLPFFVQRPLEAADEDSAGLAGLSASIELVDGAAYLKQDVKLRLTVVNPTPLLVTVPGEALGRETFSIVDDEGTRVSHAPSGEPSTSGDLSIQGYDAAKVIVDLSSWYPKLASRKKDWSVEWSYGPVKSELFRFRIIRPYDKRKDRVVLMDTELGTIRWELLPELAPQHVKRFVDLTRQGFYDGLNIFRYIPGVQLEGGDPKGDGTGAWQNLMPPEIGSSLKMEPGLVGAARRSTSMTSDCMFFITLGPSEYMKGLHTFYARVTDGWGAIARINQVPNKGRTGYRDEFLLLDPVTIHSVRIK